jgi:tagaturonate epimerase
MAIKEDFAMQTMTTLGQVITPSFCAIPAGYLALVNTPKGRELAVVSAARAARDMPWKGGEFTDVEGAKGVKLGVLPLNSNNAALVRRLVGWTSPTSCGVDGVSVAFSDWLGIINSQLPVLFRHKHIKPVLVDFTPAESTALHRNFLEPMDAATWSVLSSGYRGGWSAVAAALKDEGDIVKALLYDYSGIGVDCSDRIDRSVEKLSDEEVQKKFGALDRDFKEAIDKSYLDVEFKLGDEVLKFEEIQLHRMVLEYGQAVMFLQKMYKDYLDDTPWDRDFEVDLSNSTKPMTPQEHYFLANELKRAAVKFDTLCVDAVTMREEMAANGTLHAAIAKAFDYRVSFTNCTLVFDDLEDAAKALHHKVNFKLTKLLWIAALQTVAETDQALLVRLAERIGQPVPAREDLEPGNPVCMVFATSYDRLLADRDEKGKDPLHVAASVQAHVGTYESKLTALVNKYIRTL